LYRHFVLELQAFLKKRGLPQSGIAGVVLEFSKMSAKIMLKNGYKVMCVNWAGSMTDMDIANAAVEQKGEEGGEDNDCEEGQSECISHGMAQQYVDTLLREYSNTVTLQVPGKFILLWGGVKQFKKTRYHYTLYFRITLIV
jgi:hypothetical protein